MEAVFQKYPDGLSQFRLPGGTLGLKSCLDKWHDCYDACNKKLTPESDAANACYQQCNTKTNNGNEPC